MFKKGFEKVAAKDTGFVAGAKKVGKTIGKSWNNASHLDQAGLGALAIAPAYHGYKAIKNKDKGEGALAATELGGLGLLSRSVMKGHK
jgi:hypothetical protein